MDRTRIKLPFKMGTTENDLEKETREIIKAKIMKPHLDVDDSAFFHNKMILKFLGHEKILYNNNLWIECLPIVEEEWYVEFILRGFAERKRKKVESGKKSWWRKSK